MLANLITAAIKAATTTGKLNTNHKIYKNFLHPALEQVQGTHTIEQVTADIEAPDNNAYVRSALENYLTGNPEAIDQLQHALPGQTGGSTFAKSDDIFYGGDN